MAKIDGYLRSIEKFGAAGAILTSGQAVTLRFPTGDRHATQVTPHDQLVMMVREIAPPPALDVIDKGRPGRFDFDSNGTRYGLSVVPKPGLWQVTIETAAAAEPPPQVTAGQTSPPTLRNPRPPTAVASADGNDMAIERGQYDGSSPAVTTSGSVLLDQLTAAARGARATDIYLATGMAPMIRVGPELQPVGDRGALDAETLSRELGAIAPANVRGTWTETGVGMFTYGDGIGRVRATLARDHRGPCATLRLLVGEPPALDRLGLGKEVTSWLDQRGFIVVAGPSGCGKTTTLAAMVRALGEKRRRVIAIEDPIEIVHVSSASVSQRAVGEHVPGVAAGVAAAMNEGADAIVVGTVASADAARATLDAVGAGLLVLATITVPVAGLALEVLVDQLPVERRDLARTILADAHLGTIGPVLRGTQRSFEVLNGRPSG
ncbi:MAG: Twitching motility protein PilT [Myxococcales bacterium]|nr:Twitching motility protein PilT [Myxococcales bacterium]